MPEQAFWKDKPLNELTRQQWEALCDGCGRCCLYKLEDEDTAELFYSNVACHLLDGHSCRCTRYPQRTELVPDCLTLSTETPERFRWLPSTCAYRILAEGGELPDWHPLLSGDTDSVHQAGISVRGKHVSEENVHPDQLVEHIVTWID